MTRKRRWIYASIAALVLVGAAVAGWWRWRGPRIEPIVPQRAEIVQTLVAIGRVAAPAEVVFAARESTKITRVDVDEGTHVAAGALIVQMDQAEAEAIVVQARASLQQAQAHTQQVSTIAGPSAAAALREARATLDEAQRELERDEALFHSGALDEAEVDVSRTAVTVARSRRRTAELQQASLSTRGADWQSAIAAEMFAEAGLVAAQARLDRLRVLAPSAGTVIERSVEVGDVVQVGTRLARMTLDGRTRLVIEPDEKNLRTLAIGQPALASAEAFPDEHFAARVEFIAPAVDAVRGTIEVRLAVPDPPPYLRTDMTVSVEIEVARADAAVAVPLAAVRELASEHPWALVVEHGIAVRRELRLGLRGDAQVEVREGLAGDASIIPADVTAIEPGDRVR